MCVALDPWLSDPGDGVQAQLWGTSSCSHGLRKVSQFPCVTDTETPGNPVLLHVWVEDFKKILFCLFCFSCNMGCHEA